MKMLVFADLHSENVPELEIDPDIVIILGDMNPYTVKDIDKMYSCTKVGVAGNHDRNGIYDRTDIVDLHAKTFKWNNLTFAGFGGCPRYNSRTYGQYTNFEAQQFVNSLREKVDIFISHANVVYRENTEDYFDHKKGFKAFNDFINLQQPRLFLHGHLHDPKISRIGNTEIHSIYGASVLEI